MMEFYTAAIYKALKLLQDCMTKLGYWADDNQIALLSTAKLYGEKPGIWIKVEEVEEGW